MKKVLKAAIVTLIAVSLVLGMASCGGNDSPKGLAKQAVDLNVAMDKLLKNETSMDDPKWAPILKKAEELTPKVEALSEADAEIFYAEVKRLAEKAGLEVYF